MVALHDTHTYGLTQVDTLLTIYAFNIWMVVVDIVYGQGFPITIYFDEDYMPP
jgi:hypothetical protein